MHETAQAILRQKRETILQELDARSSEASPAKDIISVLRELFQCIRHTGFQLSPPGYF
jgi:hypothetical protein